MRDDLIESKKDRRKTPRVIFEFLSLIRTEKTDTERERNVAGRVSNISSDGAFFHTREKLQEKTPVSLDIFLFQNPEAHTSEKDRIKVIRVSGNIVRTEPEGLAIKFNEELRTEVSSLEEIAGAII